MPIDKNDIPEKIVSPSELLEMFPQLKTVYGWTNPDVGRYVITGIVPGTRKNRSVQINTHQFVDFLNSFNHNIDLKKITIIRL